MALDTAVRAAVRALPAITWRAVRGAVRVREQAGERRVGAARGAVAWRAGLPGGDADAGQPRSCAAAVDGDQPRTAAEPGGDRGAVPGRLHHRLHRRRAAARAGTRPDPRRGLPGADDLQRAPGDL